MTTLTISNITRDEAIALMGLAPATATVKLEERTTAQRAPARKPRAVGVSKRLLARMASQGGTMTRVQVRETAKRLGSANPHACLGDNLAKGWLTECAPDQIRLTDDGRAVINGMA